MDIHRCRFVPYPPQPINALAFSHKSDPKKRAPSDLRLALGRNNGDIEIWNPSNGLWLQEISLKGSKSTTIEHLAWTQDLMVDEDAATNAQKSSKGPLRLFSTGGSTAVTEWDLSTGTPKRTAEGNFGDIWCMSTQPQLKDSEVPNALSPGAGSQLLAAGCSDGTIILFSTEDDDLRYVRALVQAPVKKSKVLSLAWRDRKTLVAGYEDSTIRVVDVPSRRIIRNMSLGKSAEGSALVVWSVKCLPDETIVSGDSSGELKIWDSKNFSLVQRLTSHRADILDIAYSASGDTIFSVSVDRRTVTYKQVPLHSGTQKTRWAEVAHKRYHQYDVKCAVAYESKDLSVLVSGGMDTRPVVVPIRRSQSEYHRGLPHLPQRSQISASKSSRLFISWWDHEVMIYQVRRYQNPQNDTDSDGYAESHYDTLAKLVLQDKENIQGAQISPDGQFVVAATSNSVKSFQLRKSALAGRPSLRTRPLELPHSVARLGARRVGFSPDGKWLFCVRKDNAVALTKLVPSEDPKEQPFISEKTVKLYRQSRNRPSSALGTYEQTITQITFSSDSRVLAVGDLCGAIDTWILEGHEDLTFIDSADSDDSSNSSDASSSRDSSDEDDDSSSPVIHAQKWIRNPSGSIPTLESAVLTLTFRPSLASSSHTTHDNLGIHATRQTPHPVAQELPSAQTAHLIAITATHQLLEFDVLSSRLSDWSRRNPSAYLPHDFTRIKDRVVGTFWDCTDVKSKGERLWLYGSTWIFMLDVSKDLSQVNQNGHRRGLSHGISDGEKIGQLGPYAVLEPLSNSADASTSGQQEGQKLLPATPSPMKQEHENTRKKRKRNTGAGDTIRLAERESGVGDTFRRFKGTGGDDSEMIDIDANDTLGNGIDDGDMDMENSPDDTLALMRRAEKAEQSTTAAPKVTPSQQTTKKSTQQNPTKRAWTHWLTFEYHSILGITVIGPASSSSPSSSTTEPTAMVTDSKTDEHDSVETKASENIEVIIVERPLHDVDQVPRFDGGQEWDV
ncbi:U3 small nucleolar RNA-associated protein [Cladophialophora chaetospira]|uniref:U3 small nucleolar RNA-associated protein n=1 Tax=Cladophialophora chaetospira TaxID=386627 RepID=A0AA39CEA3_9EURO|nr:U3 small nucleolar RNA-associated protein [Cladophialophora chaetospira]